MVTANFDVPRFIGAEITTSSLIVADLVESSKSRTGRGQFVIGATKVRPNVSRIFRSNQNLGVYLQVYNVQIDQTTLQPAVDVEYVITRKGKEVLRLKEDGGNGITDLTGYARQVTLGRTFPLKDLEPGNYEVSVEVTDRVARTKRTPKTYFSIINN